MRFVDRKQELNALDNAHRRESAELIILFGRRRVGKTRLLTYFLETRQIQQPLYWMATTHSAAVQLRDFSQALLQHDPRFVIPLTPDYSFPDWEAAFNHMAGMVAAAEGVQWIVLDEFSYLIRNDATLVSVLQKVWDHQLSKLPNLRLVLTGSLVGMMQREIFAYNAPLYGRATTQLRLQPLPYAALIDLFPERESAERVAIYAVTGGVPAYVERFTRTDQFVTALRDECLQTGSIMLSDPALILHDQLSEPQTYESILRAIASGFHQWGEIAKMSGVTESSLGHYLNLLQELELVERRDPVLAKPRSRQGRYHLSDHFLRFYYRFIVPRLATIERGYTAAAVEKIWAELRAFIGTHVFEELCQEWVWSAAALEQLSFHPEQVGSYWRRAKGKRGVQLDVVAANAREKRLLIGEAKWGRGAVSRAVLRDLIERSQRMAQVEAGWQVQYALFAHEGFTEATVELAGEIGAVLVSAEMIEQTLLAFQAHL